MLEAKELTKQYKGLRAVADYSVRIKQGEIRGLIGPNGAGKTTTFNLLTSLVKSTSGTIYFEGKDITGIRPDQIAEMGICRTFQNIRLFKNLTVLENVLIATQINKNYNFLSVLLSLPSFLKEEKRLINYSLEILETMGLLYAKDIKARNLPYGQQRKLEIARALAVKPKLLLLDEPAAGMNPKESLELMELIRLLRGKFKLTILLIEHDMKFVMNLCEQIQVLSYGMLIAEGTAEEIRNNPEVISAYLGRAAEGA
ncbi:ABC transporter ATP-binding protein [Desulforamulus aquiferis]|uniref:ABC transporter ATP-binding protein n=1 Tax=Desulforamulus aquiferis TaxID=1397668 RepID=A0AAW7Z8R6_9FIRM|nr:ABC transporter ATP-binding protein [Desulforamulus aquiferis]